MCICNPSIRTPRCRNCPPAELPKSEYSCLCAPCGKLFHSEDKRAVCCPTCKESVAKRSSRRYDSEKHTFTEASIMTALKNVEAGKASYKMTRASMLLLEVFNLVADVNDGIE